MSDPRSATTTNGLPLVALAAALWGTDALFRRGLALDLPATTVVLYEHLILAVLLAPVIVRIPWRGLTRADRWSLLFIGAGASALATGMFTASFALGEPNTPLLLQKLQPIIGIVAARLLLGERPRPRFAIYAGLAVGSALLITFPDVRDVRADAALAAGLAIGAATLWALGTVLGRRMSSRLTFVQLTGARFGIGLPSAAVFALLVGPGGARGLGIAGADLVPLVSLALVPGLFALLLYYRGLRSTPASAATIAELAFPAAALSVNHLAFGATVTASQLVGVVMLSGTLIALSRGGRGTASDVGIDVPDASRRESVPAASSPRV
jgi:DME family drug/metabolite transporter